MRAVIAKTDHETNTFSPIPTSWSRFEEVLAVFGDDVPARLAGEREATNAFLMLAADAGMEVVTPVAADANPGGVVSADAYERIAGAICDAVAEGCDAVMLDIHGAMVTETTPDGEGTLLERIRKIAPKVPIAVVCDMHANLTAAMVENSTVLVGYKTYPHLDRYDMGLRAGGILLRAMKGEVEPVMAWGNVPLLAQTLRMGHDDEPMGTLQEMTREMEKGGILAATAFGGFPLADIRDAGLSAVVVADGDRAAAQRAVDRLLDFAWEHRAEFVYRGEPLKDAVARAAALREYPVILLDHADNVASGGTSDVMMVLAEVLRQGLDRVVAGPIWDAGAVKKMAEAGIGAQVALPLGGKTDMPAIGLKGEPLDVRGTVRRISDGLFTMQAGVNKGIRRGMGPAALLDMGKAQVLVCSKRVEPVDPGVFASVGIDAAGANYILLKSRIHYRAGFAGLARHTVLCDGKGVTSSDNSQFRFRNVRRPIYPLDKNAPRGRCGQPFRQGAK